VLNIVCLPKIFFGVGHINIIAVIKYDEKNHMNQYNGCPENPSETA
jgi:hypothetical protein